MKPHIDSTAFGSITIDGKRYKNDVVIRKNGEIVKRKKELSKKVYGTSHKVSKKEIEFVLDKKVSDIIIGSGQYGVLELSDGAKVLLNKKNITIHVYKTPDVINKWNLFDGKAVGLFHVSC